MKFSDFSLSFSHVVKGSPLAWKKGKVFCYGSESKVIKDLAARIPWSFELRITEGPCSITPPEGYTLDISCEKVLLSAPSERGLLYGMWTLIRFGELEDKAECTITDIPIAPQRGLKLYLPPPDESSIREFYAIIDLALRYKYNFLMLELGGAMEYLSHPEINEAYLKYASFMNEYPAKAMKIQNSFPWRKNSIHTENGGGRILSQKQIREIITYCRERGLEIVPEIPSLSHCDYMLAAHPHLAERPEDPYPDTACPSQEGYYTLLFDILKETVELFHPKRINIGHDEYYTIGLCPECRKKTAPKIYADDINRTAAFLKTFGVKTIIWGDKLLDAHFLSGGPCGGAEIPEGTEGKECIPATFPAADLIDPGIEIFHWYWSIDRKLDLEYEKRNLKYLFGNFGSVELPDWKKRSAANSFQGVCVSNWGRTDYETMRRNGIIFDLICSACLCWNKELGSEDYKQLFDVVSAELEQLDRNRSGNTDSFFEICHTAETDIEFLYFFDGNYLDEKDFFLGEHIFVSESGKQYRFPVIFGKHISNAQNFPGRICDPLSDFDRYIVNRQYIEILGGALPLRDKEGKMWYKARYPHPDPGEKLTYKEFRPLGKHKCSVQFKEEWSDLS